MSRDFEHLTTSDLRALRHANASGSTLGEGGDWCERCGHKGGCSWTMSNADRYWLCPGCTEDVLSSRRARHAGVLGVSVP